jgi:hypothetical protein
MSFATFDEVISPVRIFSNSSKTALTFVPAKAFEKKFMKSLSSLLWDINICAMFTSSFEVFLFFL